jgi:hypothetical protein
MSSKAREALEKFNAVDLSGLEFPLDGDSTTIYNSDKEEITIPYWRVAELLNEVKVAQDMAKAALAEPLRNCDVGTADEQYKRFDKICFSGRTTEDCPLFEKTSPCCSPFCFARWSQMPYEEGTK